MNRNAQTALRTLMILFLLPVAGAVANDYLIDWWTVDGGGGMWIPGGDWELSGTIGQPDASPAIMTGGDYGVVGGFWNIYVTSPLNDPPVAVAGDDQATYRGQTVDLDGSGSFDDNTNTEDLVYAWTFADTPAGSSATLLNANTASPSFVVDLLGTYTVSLVVADDEGLWSEPDTVTISSENLAPTAEAGPDQGAYPADLVELDGTGSSDPENDPLAYTWEMVAVPDGSTAALDDEHDATPTFTPDILGEYRVQLVVNDGFVDSASDEVVISVVTPEEFAENNTVEVLNIVVELTPEEVTTSGNQTALGNFQTQAIAALQTDDIDEAIDKLTKALNRTDGCVLRGEPDGRGPGRDWITDCAVQEEVYWLLKDALDAISSP